MQCATKRDPVRGRLIMSVPVASVEDPRKALGAGCDKWGEQRMALALEVQKLLEAEKLTWFIESGAPHACHGMHAGRAHLAHLVGGRHSSGRLAQRQVHPS